MKLSKPAICVGFAIVLTVLQGCGKKTLSRGEALQRVQQVPSMRQSIDFLLSSVTHSGKDDVGAYLELANRNVLVCHQERDEISFQGGWFLNCSPGPQGAFQQVNQGLALSFTAGMLAPSEVTGLTPLGDTAMQADVRLDFQPTPYFQSHRDIWLRLSPGFQSQIGSRVVSVRFQLYDDGWRLVR
jgi:hypothetical protein